MYSVQGIPDQVVEHWDEDQLYRSVPFARLVVLAKRGWRTRSGRLVDAGSLEALVGHSIERVAA
jgi:hypothetical protein